LQTTDQTRAYNNVWAYVESASKAPQVVNIHNWLEDINSEGKILREINSILEEIQTMLYVLTTQQIELERFSKRLKWALGSSPLSGIIKPQLDHQNDPSPQTLRSKSQNLASDQHLVLESAQLVADKLQVRMSLLNNLKDLGKRTESAVSHLRIKTLLNLKLILYKSLISSSLSNSNLLVSIWLDKQSCRQTKQCGKGAQLCCLQ